MSVFMLSENFMKFLFSYKKDEFEPEKHVKEINFKNGGGKLVRVFAEISK